MAVGSGEYLAQLKALLPPGPAWPHDDELSMLALLMETWALEFARVDARVQTLISENDPRFCTETFQEWLTQWGIPDECLLVWGSLLEDGLSEKTLRQALVQKITTAGAQTIDYFVQLARNYGYYITIDEMSPFNVKSQVTDVLAEEQWQFVWRVNVHNQGASVTTEHDVMGGVDEALAWWGDSIIECLIKKYAPAHTQVLFGYF